MNHYRLKACGKCSGDLALDDGDWICLQCGTYYYIGLYRRDYPAFDLPGAGRPEMPDLPLQAPRNSGAAPSQAELPGLRFPAAGREKSGAGAAASVSVSVSAFSLAAPVCWAVIR